MEPAAQTGRALPEVFRMVTVHDRLTEELQRSCLRLNDELIFRPQKYGQDTFIHIEIPSAARFFRVGFAEYAFLSQFNGNTTFAAALAVVAQSQGADALSEQQAREIVSWLLENGLAGFAGEESGIDAKKVQENKTNLLSKLNPFWLKFPFGNPDQLFASALPWCRAVLHPLMLALVTIFILAGLFTALVNWKGLFGGYHVFASGNWVWLLVSWIALKLVHEFAHGIVCKYFGGQVRETGLIFILFAPLAYVDVTSSWRFANRWKRIAVASAGIIVELTIASACVFALLYTQSEVVRDILTNTILMAGLTTLLFNANPLMRFDGYFVLADLLKIPNLYENGSAAFRQDMGWLFLGQSPNSSCREIRTRRLIVSIYGWLASVWKVLICVGLSIAASAMFGGFGILLAAFGIFSWFGKPCFEMFKRLSIHFKQRPSSLIRTGFLTALTASFILASWFWIPSPFSVRAPCLVQYEDATRVRAETAGFIVELLAQEGDRVKAGDALLRIENRELETEVAELRAKLQYEQTRERIALDQSKAGEAQIAAREQHATTTKLVSRQSELNNLLVKAPCSGKIVARDFEHLQDKYVSRGDVLLLIGDENTKELVISLPATELDSAKRMVGTSIPLEIGHRRKFQATVDRINPRATMQVSHESLIDPNGGPIAVRQSADRPEHDDSATEYEYLHPRLKMVARIDDTVATTLFAGQRGRAVLPGSTETLGKSAYLAIREWILNQIRLVDTDT